MFSIIFIYNSIVHNNLREDKNFDYRKGVDKIIIFVKEYDLTRFSTISKIEGKFSLLRH